MNHLRIIDGRRVGGIIVPFNKRDKHGTTFTRATDFMLSLFRDRPVFLLHNLDAQRVGRAGTLLDPTIEFREEGVYAEATLEETVLGNIGFDLVAAGRAAWSSGAWPTPNTLQVDKSGLVHRWALAEASICDVSQVSSPPDSVRVVHIRAALPDEQISNDAALVRSEWLMPPDATNGHIPVVDPVPPVIVPPVVPPVAPSGRETFVMSPADLQRVVQNTIEQVMREQPTRSLPNQTTPVVVGGGNQNTVSSPYDRVSLMGMLLWDEMRRRDRNAAGFGHKRDEIFMRSLVDKARVQHELDLKQAVPLSGDYPERPLVPFRALTNDVFDLWHGRVPHLRADEAMQSTLVNYGDELVPTLLNSAAWFFFRMESKVFGLLQMFDMPSQPYDYPKFTSGFRLRGVDETEHLSQLSLPTSPIKSVTIGTDKVAFSAGELGAMLIASKQMLQDSGINLADGIAQMFVREVAASLDYFILNGDERATTDNISYSADPSGTALDGLLKFDGLRRMAQAASDSQAHTTISEDTPATHAKLMGARGIIGRDIKNLVMVIDPGSAYKADALDAYEEIQKVGDQATLLNGQVGQLKGVPLVCSDELRNADSSGKMTSSDNGTLGQQVLIHRPGIFVGRKQDTVMDMMQLPFSNASAWWVTLRIDVKQMESGHVAWGYNTTI